MKLADFINRIPMYYQMSAEDDGLSVHLEGGPGRGKTSAMRKAPALTEAKFPELAKKGVGLVIVNGTNVSLTTMTGYLWPVEIDGVAHSRFTKPDWWCKTYNSKGEFVGLPLEAFDAGYIFVDEADKMPLDEKKILGDARLSKIFASHRLPPGWVVWSAGNRAKDRAGSTKEFDHDINRQMRLNISDDLQGLAAFMREIGCLPEVIHFAEEHPEIVFPDGPPEVQGPFCTPRSLCAADAKLQGQMEYEGTSEIPMDPTTVEELNGIIGAGAAAQLAVSIKLGQELPSYEEIIKAPKTIRIPTRADARGLACMKLARQVEAKDAPAVIDYVTRLGDEFAVIFAKDAIARDRKFVNLPAFRAWAMKNASLVSIIGVLK